MSIELLKSELAAKRPAKVVVVSMPLLQELRREGELSVRKHALPAPSDRKYAQGIAEWLDVRFPILITDNLNWYTYRLKNHGGIRIVADIEVDRLLSDDGAGSYEII